MAEPVNTTEEDYDDLTSGNRQSSVYASIVFRSVVDLITNKNTPGLQCFAQRMAQLHSQDIQQSMQPTS